MSGCRCARFVVAALVAVVSLRASRAEDARPAPSFDGGRLAELEGEVAELRARLDQQPSTTSAASPQPLFVPGVFDPQAGNGGFFAGYEFLFVQPHFEKDEALIAYTQTGGPLAPLEPQVTTFDRKFELTPRVFAGYVSESGFGGRFRYWQFDHGATASNGPVDLNGAQILSSAAITPQTMTGIVGAIWVPANLNTDFPGDTLRASHSLFLSTSDFEATQQFRLQRSVFTIAAGLRYLRMDQRYEVSLNAGDGTLQGFLRHDHDFEGFGPTLAIEWLRTFGSTGLAFYANGRGSAAFGERNQALTIVNPDNVNIPIDSFQQFRNERAQMGVGEVGIGLQYTRGILTVRGGYEGQIWTNTGNAASTEGNMGLQGLAASLGLAY